MTRVAVSAAPITIQILSFFEEWRPRSELADELDRYSPESIGDAIQQLIDRTLLVEEGTEVATSDEAVARAWQYWMPHGAFHFATKDAAFVPQEEWPALAADFLSAADQPSLTKRYPDRPAHPLPPATEEQDAFLRVLLARKTHREYSGASVPLTSLATLLRYTWGTIGTVDSPNFGPLLQKTSPSGGARHPGEVYVAVLDVEGMAPGYYHYDHETHALERLHDRTFTTDEMRAEVLELTLGQEHVGAAGAVCFMTAVLPRTWFKYRAPRAYRIVSLETGHLGQTFCLVATWLGLAPFVTAAVVDTAIERRLGIDGIEETALYVAGVGMPVDVSRD